MSVSEKSNVDAGRKPRYETPTSQAARDLESLSERLLEYRQVVEAFNAFQKRTVKPNQTVTDLWHEYQRPYGKMWTCLRDENGEETEIRHGDLRYYWKGDRNSLVRAWVNYILTEGVGFTEQSAYKRVQQILHNAPADSVIHSFDTRGPVKPWGAQEWQPQGYVAIKNCTIVEVINNAMPSYISERWRKMMMT